MTTLDVTTPENQRRAERKLAALLLIHADLEVDPDGLGVFIRENWAKISPLAHIIHGQHANGGTAKGENSDGWIEWNSTESPVEHGYLVDIRDAKSGLYTARARARTVDWSRVSAYRVVEP